MKTLALSILIWFFGVSNVTIYDSEMAYVIDHLAGIIAFAVYYSLFPVVIYLLRKRIFTPLRTKEMMLNGHRPSTGK